MKTNFLLPRAAFWSRLVGVLFILASLGLPNFAWGQTPPEVWTASYSYFPPIQCGGTGHFTIHIRNLPGVVPVLANGTYSATITTSNMAPSYGGSVSGGPQSADVQITGVPHGAIVTSFSASTPNHGSQTFSLAPMTVRGPAPALQVPASLTRCAAAGQPATFSFSASAAGEANVTYSCQGCTSSANGNFTVNTSSSTSVSITATNPCGSTTRQVALVVAANPLAPVISASVSECNVTFTADGPVDWSSSANGQQATNTNAFSVSGVSGAISVTATRTNSQGCVTLPQLAITGPNQVDCGTSATLEATGAGDNATYEWSNGANTKTMSTTTITTTQSFRVRAVSTANPSCVGAWSSEFFVYPRTTLMAPNLTANQTNNIACGASVILSASGGGQGVVAYRWSGGTPSGTNSNTLNTGPLNTSESVFWVEAIGAGGVCASPRTYITLRTTCGGGGSSCTATLQGTVTPAICGTDDPMGRIVLSWNSTCPARIVWSDMPNGPSVSARNLRPGVYHVSLYNGERHITSRTFLVGFDIAWQPALGSLKTSRNNSISPNDFVGIIAPSPTANSRIGFTPKVQAASVADLKYYFDLQGNGTYTAMANGQAVATGSFGPNTNFSIQRSQDLSRVVFSVNGSPVFYATGNPAEQLRVAVQHMGGPEPQVIASFCAAGRLRDLCENENENFVRTRQISVGNVRNLADLPLLDPTKGEVQIATEYFDGLGRPLQSVGHFGSPTTKDVIQPRRYDALGRQPIAFLPYTIGGGCSGYRPNAVGQPQQYPASEQFNFYQPAGNVPDVAQDQFPYAVTDFEASPLDRALRTGAPGAAWQPASTWLPDQEPQATDRTVKQRSRPNDLGEVRIWQTREELGFWRGSGFYPAGTLTVAETYDEHNQRVQQFTDRSGKVLLKRVQTNTDHQGQPVTGVAWAQTYYIYDDLDRLVVVMQPEGVRVLEATFPRFRADLNQGDPTRDAYMFLYRYDERGRLTHKHVPGTVGYDLYVYDRRDRQVLASRRPVAAISGSEPATTEWLYTKYDELNRPVLTGEHASAATSQPQMAANVNAVAANFEVRNGNQATHGYTLGNTFPTNAQAANVLTANYYDRYDGIPDLGTLAYPISPSDLLPATADRPLANRGRAVASRAKALITSGPVPVPYLATVTWYDKFGRPVQVNAQNAKGGRNITTTRYDFDATTRAAPPNCTNR